MPKKRRKLGGKKPVEQRVARSCTRSPTSDGPRICASKRHECMKHTTTERLAVGKIGERSASGFELIELQKSMDAMQRYIGRCSMCDRSVEKRQRMFGFALEHIHNTKKRVAIAFF